MAKASGILTISADTSPMEKRIGEVINKKYTVTVGAKNSNALGTISKNADQFSESLKAAEARVVAFGAVTGIIYTATSALQAMVSATLDVEQRLTDINVLLNLSGKQLNLFGAELFSIAKNTAQSFAAVSDVAKEFSRQGLSVEETLKRTTAALVLVRQSGLETEAAVGAITSAINSFATEMNTAAEITNKFAAVDQAFAVSSKDLAEAVSRVGSTAVDAGVSLDELLGIVTAVQQTTSRGGAVIGNALKTIFTRIGNKEAISQLKELGVQINDSQSGLEKLQAISQGIELNPQYANEIKRISGGVYQINIVSAALKDLQNQYGITFQATQKAANAQNEAFDRNIKQNQTLATVVQNTQQNLIALGASLGKDLFGPSINNLLGGLNETFDKIKDVDEGSFIDLGLRIGKGITTGIGEYLSGPGAVLFTAIFAKIASRFAGYIKQSFSLNAVFADSRAPTAAENTALATTKILQQQPDILRAVLNGTMSVKEAELSVLSIMTKQNLALERQRELISAIAKQVAIGSPVVPSLVATPSPASKPVKKASGGLIPHYAEISEKIGAIQGGYTPGEVKTKNVKGLGKIFYNDAEKVVQFPGMEQPAIMPPKNSKAGKNYKKDFENKFGFNPYKSEGLVPSFAKPKVPKSGVSALELEKQIAQNVARRKAMEHYELGQQKAFLYEGKVYGVRSHGEGPELVDKYKVDLSKSIRMQKVNDQWVAELSQDQGISNSNRATLGLLNARVTNPNQNKDVRNSGLYNNEGIVPNFAGLGSPLLRAFKSTKERLRSGEVTVTNSKSIKDVYKYSDVGGLYDNQIDEIVVDKTNLVGPYNTGILMAHEGTHRIFGRYDHERTKDHVLKELEKGTPANDIYRAKGPDSIRQRLVNASIDFDNNTPQDIKNDIPSYKITASRPDLYGKGSIMEEMIANDTLSTIKDRETLSPYLGLDSKKLRKVSGLYRRLFDASMQGVYKNKQLGFRDDVVPNFAKDFPYLDRGAFAKVYKINDSLVGKVFDPVPQAIKMLGGRDKALQSFNETREGLEYAYNLAKEQELPVNVARTYKPGSFSFFDRHRRDADEFTKRFGKEVYFQDYVKPDSSPDMPERERAHDLLNSAARKKRGNKIVGFGDLIHNPKNFLGNTIVDLLARKNAFNKGYIPDLEMYGSGMIPKIPNYNNILGYAPEVQEAIQREKEAGVPLSRIRIGKDNRIKGRENPQGLGIYNTIHEPLGIKQGINRAIQENVNPKTYGASKGIVPNFARKDIEFGSGDPKKRFVKGTPDEYEEVSRAIEDLKGQLQSGIIKQKNLNKVIDGLAKTYNLTDRSTRKIQTNLAKSASFAEAKKEKRASEIERADEIISKSTRGTFRIEKPSSISQKVATQSTGGDLLSQGELIAKRFPDTTRKRTTPLQTGVQIVAKQSKVDREQYSSAEKGAFSVMQQLGQKIAQKKAEQEAKKQAVIDSDKKANNDLDDTELRAKRTFSGIYAQVAEDKKTFNTPRSKRVVDLSKTIQDQQQQSAIRDRIRSGAFLHDDPASTPRLFNQGFAGNTSKKFYEAASDKRFENSKIGKFAGGAANIGLGLGFLAPIVSETIQQFVGNDSLKKRRVNSVVGGVSDVLSYGGTGATIGAVFGPAGAGIGAVLGVATGGFIGITKAIKEFDNELPEIETQLNDLEKAASKTSAGLSAYINATQQLDEVYSGRIKAQPEQIRRIQEAIPESLKSANLSQAQLDRIALAKTSDEKIRAVTEISAETSSINDNKRKSLEAQRVFENISNEPSKLFKNNSFLSSEKADSFFNASSFSAVPIPPRVVKEGAKLPGLRVDPVLNDQLTSALNAVLSTKTNSGESFEDFFKNLTGPLSGKAAFDRTKDPESQFAIFTSAVRKAGLEDNFSSLFELQDKFQGKTFGPFVKIINDQLNKRTQLDNAVITEEQVTRSNLTNTIAASVLESIQKNFNTALNNLIVDAEITNKTAEETAQIDTASREGSLALQNRFLSESDQAAKKFNNTLIELEQSFKLLADKKAVDTIIDTRRAIESLTSDLIDKNSRTASEQGVVEGEKTSILNQTAAFGTALRNIADSVQSPEDISKAIASLRSNLRDNQKILEDRELRGGRRKALEDEGKTLQRTIDALNQLQTSYDKTNAGINVQADLQKKLAGVQNDTVQALIRQAQALNNLGGLGGGNRVSEAGSELFNLQNRLDVSSTLGDVSTQTDILARMAEVYEKINVELPDNIRKQLESVQATLINQQIGQGLRAPLSDNEINDLSSQQVSARFPKGSSIALPNGNNIAPIPQLPEVLVESVKTQSDAFSSIKNQQSAILELEKTRLNLNEALANNSIDLLEAQNAYSTELAKQLSIQEKFKDYLVILRSSADSVREQADLFADVQEREEFIHNSEQDRISIQKKINAGLQDGLKAQKEYTLLQAQRNALQAEEAFNAGRIGSETLRTYNALKRAAELNSSGKLKNNSIGEAFGDQFKYNNIDFYKDLNDAAVDFGQTFKSSIKGAFAEFQDGTKSAKEALTDLGLGLARFLGNKAFDIGLNNILGATLGNIKFAKGGQVKGYSTGGLVTGGSGVKDDVPALLTKDEYVINKSATKRYGIDFLESINDKRIIYDGETTKTNSSANSVNSVFKNTIKLNDPVNPTKGTFLADDALSSFALEDENNPQNAFRYRREELLGNYIRNNQKILEEYNKKKDNQLNAALFQAGVSLIGVGVGAAAGNLGGTKGGTTSINGATGNTLSSSPYQTGLSYNSAGVSGGSSFNPSVPSQLSGYGSYTNFRYATIGRYAKGGKIKKYAYGGGVFGGDSYSDRIPALLTDGEFVITKEASRHYGKNFLDEINGKKVAKFADGGSVATDYAGSSSGSAPFEDLTQTLESLKATLEELISTSSEKSSSPLPNSGSTQPQITLHIENHINQDRNGGTSVSTTSSSQKSGSDESKNSESAKNSKEENQRQAEQLKLLGERMSSVARKVIIEELRPNGLFEGLKR